MEDETSDHEIDGVEEVAMYLSNEGDGENAGKEDEADAPVREPQ